MRKKDRNYYRFAKKKKNKTKQYKFWLHMRMCHKQKSYLITNMPLYLLQNSFFAISQENLPKTSPNKSECWKKCVFLLHLAGHGRRIKPLYNYAKNVSVLLLFFRILSFLTLSLFSWDLVVKILICFFCDSWPILVESYWQFTLLAK